jgi:hypothetical protein
LALVAIASSLGASSTTGEEKPSFVPAEVKEVGDNLNFAPGRVSGTVILNAVIADEGTPKAIEVRRGIDGLTGAASDAVKDWTFSAALVDGKPVTTRVVVAVTLHPWGPGLGPVALTESLPQSDEAIQAAFQPPEVLAAAFPLYPDLIAVGGAVVLEVDLDEHSQPGDTKILKDLPPLTETCMESLKKWRFRAATNNGSPIPSKIVLAFVFLAYSPAPPPSN